MKPTIIEVRGDGNIKIIQGQVKGFTNKWVALEDYNKLEKQNKSLTIQLIKERRDFLRLKEFMKTPYSLEFDSWEQLNEVKR